MRLTTYTTSSLTFLGLAAFAVAQSSDDLSWVPFDRENFDGNVALDTDGHVQLFWKTGDTNSTFGIASRSSGYLALGFSQTGAMTGADMAVGYKDQDGNFIFENRHAMGFVTPEISQDQGNNMRLQEGHQADGVTSFVFEKQNEADCLETQASVAKDSWQWFIYAFSNENNFAIHAPGNNGKKYVKLGTGKTVSTNDIREIDNAKNFTIAQPELTIPTAETTYCYTLHKLPAGKKNYLLGERPNGSSKLLHHLVLYACYGLPDEYLDMLGKEANCNYEEFSNPCNGFVTEWAPGMSGRTFEPGYGKPFGTDHYEYAMLETHYNNPQGIEGEKDTAAYTFLYTNDPVDTEIGTLTLGDLQVQGWFLEPGKPLVAHSTICTPECTDRWPSGGITAVSVFHHMHYRGRNTRVQIIRDGKEITPLSTLRDFEYGYQFSKSLNSIKLLPGDQLITTCEYDTSNDTKPVPGGLPSKDEMCFAWVDYYPANNILACTQMETGNSPKNTINGTAAFCLDSSAETQDVYDSPFLTATFQNLTASGNTCPVGNTTSGPSNQAAVLMTCPETDVCFSLNVPEESASSSSGDIYFQLSVPTTYSWVALAQGTTMSNANMFVMYSSADGKNVTLSPRTASGHIMPTYNKVADVSLLEGSGISNGRMTANVRCGNCDRWGTGAMSLQGGNSNWLYAHSQGSPINSDDTSASISQHDRKGSFQWNLSQATGGSGGNPFTNASYTTTTIGADRLNSWERLTTQTQKRYVQAHGALASIAFIAVLPTGAILVRLASFNGLLWTHGCLQIFGYAVFIAAAGLGIFIANGGAYLHEPHAIIGMILLGTLFFMPFLGTIHHKMYKKVQKRTAWSYGHVFTGRVIVILGMINGGLGLRLAAAKTSYLIVYGVFAALIGVAYISAVIGGEYKRSQKSSESKQLNRDESGSDISHETK
ncbi:iron reductase domain protein [Melanomma pulvis-pyrius CBS 109.77]|uniref:Iron reductase domain protein n=1 Tax=Melanomma pulvis-pyrius CBS 109.77 TaxID=1314802 RepID=A0A6A6WP26_9PLEO|nr:iron reductase domain protein [Melanomma pulvis-pyrius CBS 109.77]